eukprot:PhM_4_TR18913/c0_g1_i1/m.105004
MTLNPRTRHVSWRCSKGSTWARERMRSQRRWGPPLRHYPLRKEQRRWVLPFSQRPSSPHCCRRPQKKKAVEKRDRADSEETEDARPPCKYGAECYRQENKEHCAQFSHPGDDDDDDVPLVKKVKMTPSPPPMTKTTITASPAMGGKKPCPHGAMCFRTDATHRAQYDHGDGHHDSKPMTTKATPTPTPVPVPKPPATAAMTTPTTKKVCPHGAMC